MPNGKFGHHTGPARSGGGITNATTIANGSFAFTFTPSMTGLWYAAAQWQSDKSYYASATSEMAPLQVYSPSNVFVYIVFLLALAAVIAVAGYMIGRRTKKSSVAGFLSSRGK